MCYAHPHIVQLQVGDPSRVHGDERHFDGGTCSTGSGRRATV
jgi:hypothetical protein